jgi:hypothetical protein
MFECIAAGGTISGLQERDHLPTFLGMLHERCGATSYRTIQELLAHPVFTENGIRILWGLYLYPIAAGNEAIELLRQLVRSIQGCTDPTLRRDIGSAEDKLVTAIRLCIGTPSGVAAAAAASP